MLATRNLTFSYPDSRDAVLRFPDLDCQSGEQWLLLGQSGSGKTTLLHLLAGLRTPTAGEVQIKNQSLAKLSTGSLDQFRGKNIGVVFQQAHFVRALTVTQNLELAQSLAGQSIDKQRITQLLAHLNIEHKANDYPNNLSVGEQQRANIARAVVNRPAVILADEPTSALDDTNTHQVISLLQSQATETGASLLIVTHDNRLTSIFEKQIKL